MCVLFLQVVMITSTTQPTNVSSRNNITLGKTILINNYTVPPLLYNDDIMIMSIAEHCDNTTIGEVTVVVTGPLNMTKVRLFIIQ